MRAKNLGNVKQPDSGLASRLRPQARGEAPSMPSTSELVTQQLPLRLGSICRALAPPTDVFPISQGAKNIGADVRSVVEAQRRKSRSTPPAGPERWTTAPPPVCFGPPDNRTAIQQKKPRAWYQSPSEPQRRGLRLLRVFVCLGFHVVCSALPFCLWRLLRRAGRANFNSPLI